MQKVNIQLDYTLSTECPHCFKDIELQDHDDDVSLGMALCGGDTSWCPWCGGLNCIIDVKEAA